MRISFVTESLIDSIQFNAMFICCLSFCLPPGSLDTRPGLARVSRQRERNVPLLLSRNNPAGLSISLASLYHSLASPCLRRKHENRYLRLSVSRNANSFSERGVEEIPSVARVTLLYIVTFTNPTHRCSS